MADSHPCIVFLSHTRARTCTHAHTHPPTHRRAHTQLAPGGAWSVPFPSDRTATPVKLLALPHSGNRSSSTSYESPPWQGPPKIGCIVLPLKDKEGELDTPYQSDSRTPVGAMCGVVSHSQSGIPLFWEGNICHATHQKNKIKKLLFQNAFSRQIADPSKTLLKMDLVTSGLAVTCQLNSDPKGGLPRPGRTPPARHPPRSHAAATAAAAAATAAQSAEEA